MIFPDRRTAHPTILIIRNPEQICNTATLWRHGVAACRPRGIADPAARGESWGFTGHGRFPR
jgi:hypothetical protein